MSPCDSLPTFTFTEFCKTAKQSKFRATLNYLIILLCIVQPNPELPIWMEHLKHSLIFAKGKQRNVVMFILKLIYNCKSTFRPYADKWLDIMVDCVLFLDEVNYFIADVVSF